MAIVSVISGTMGVGHPQNTQKLIDAARCAIEIMEAKGLNGPIKNQLNKAIEDMDKWY